MTERTQSSLIWAGVVILLAVLAIIFVVPQFSNKNSVTQNQTNNSVVPEKEKTDKVAKEETDKKAKEEAEKKAGSQKETTEEPLQLQDQADNGGVKVPDSVPITVTDSPTERTGVSLTEDKQYVFVYVEKTLMNDVRKGCDGGGVKKPNDPPQCQGSYPDGEDFTDMISRTINGKDYWTTENLDIKKFGFKKNDYCIEIGNSIAGNWRKFLHDEYKRQKRGKLPGSLSNNVGGMNCWFYKPGSK